MPRPPTAELSLRHLPDISDTSFQISFADNSADLLLATHDDFLDGADDSIGPGNSGQDYLTLSQLTPKPRPRTNITTAIPASTLPRPRNNESRPIPDHRTMFTPRNLKAANRQRTPRATVKVEPESTKRINVTALAINERPSGRLHRREAKIDQFSGAGAIGQSDPGSILPTTEENAVPISREVQTRNVKKEHKTPVSDIDPDDPAQRSFILYIFCCGLLHRSRR